MAIRYAESNMPPTEWPLYIIDSILFIIYYGFYIIYNIINYILYIIMTHTRCCASTPHTWLASQPNERKAPDIVRE